MTPMTQYQGLAREVLITEWHKGTPPNINPEDLEIGVELFVQAALDKIAKKQSTQKMAALNLSEKKLPEEAPDQVIEKIKAYVKDKAWYFKRACESGFPFSLLERSASMASLKHMLKHFDSMVAHFMLQDEAVWLTEQELDARFKDPFKRLQTREITQCCSDLNRKLSKDGDKRAGYYLLWLIKQSTGAAFEIPPKDSFAPEMVMQVLSNFVASKSPLQIPHLLVEILLFTSSRLDNPLYKLVLHSEQWNTFLNFALQCLKSTISDVWPAKTKVITDFLEYMDEKNKKVIANQLSSSNDELTAKIGSHVLKGLQAATLREAIPHFTALIELLPHINDSHIEIIFGRPFVAFRQDATHYYKDDPSFTRRLNFNDARKVFIEGDLMIGVYDTRTTFGGRGVPAHLLAYDMTTEKMAWGIALNPTMGTDLSIHTAATPSTFGLPRMGPARYALQRCGEFITLQFRGTNDVYYINAKTGEIASKLVLPKAVADEYDRFHLTQEGVGYQMVRGGERTLIGGKIVDGAWQTTFECKTPSGFFLPLSTHVGFYKDFENKLHLFGPTGAYSTIENCLSAHAKGDKLYLIQKNPEKEGTCILSLRMLVTDERVVTEETQTFQIASSSAFILKLCDNGLCVLSGARRQPIFVNLLTSEIVYSQNALKEFAECVVNNDTGDIWSWDQLTCNVFKTSVTESMLMGHLKSGRGTSLLHADSSDRLFFVDIPF